MEGCFRKECQNIGNQIPLYDSLQDLFAPAFIRNTKVSYLESREKWHFQCLMCLFLLPSYELSAVPPIAAMHSDLSWEKCDLQAVQAASANKKRQSDLFILFFLIDESRSKSLIPITDTNKIINTNTYTIYFCSIIIISISMYQIL